ncbi:carboxylesterase 1-like [Rutidosis leptorrhynchoides]|uniref:carboxylesterase 1-like n=1 Tax=Rutidosis leptorrhynchoides TaxID=125765 RepID=UPI003A9A5688
MIVENPPVAVLNPDGSCTRFVSFPSTLPTPDQDSDTLVLSKDVTINQINKSGARIYISKETLTNTITPIKKLPLIVYYHAGGFVLMSASATVSHDLCNQLALVLQAVVVSVDYRLAPEHRLPAAYDDGVEALNWIMSTQDPWLTDFVDYSNCYLMGTSAGASISYHTGLHVLSSIQDFDPLNIKGLILHNLFIGGAERTESEIRLANACPYLTLSIAETLWKLSLPVGANCDHEYCNPMVSGGGLDHDVVRFKDAGCRVMMVIHDGDLMIDRQTEFAKKLESKGVETKCFYGEGDHAVEYFDKSKAEILLQQISSFMSLVN